MFKWLAIVSFVVGMLMFLFYPVSDKTLREVSRIEGWTQVESTGYRFFLCSKDDYYHTGFRALSKTGVEVSGAICEGFWFKGKTIRYD